MHAWPLLRVSRRHVEQVPGENTITPFNSDAAISGLKSVKTMVWL